MNTLQIEEVATRVLDGKKAPGMRSVLAKLGAEIIIVDSSHPMHPFVKDAGAQVYWLRNRWRCEVTEAVAADKIDLRAKLAWAAAAIALSTADHRPLGPVEIAFPVEKAVARALLMPTATVRAVLANGAGVAELADRFLVTAADVRRRLAELGGEAS